MMTTTKDKEQTIIDDDDDANMDSLFWITGTKNSKPFYSAITLWLANHDPM